MRTIATLLLATMASTGFSGDFFSPRVNKTARILETAATQEGSVVVANGWSEVAELQAALPSVDFQNSDLAVVFTGKMAVQSARALASRGIEVQSIGDAVDHVLVFVGHAADEMLKLVDHIWGAAFDIIGEGITVLKGAAEEVLSVLCGALDGAIDLALDLVGCAITHLQAAWDMVLDFARCVLEHATELVVKAANGVICVAKCVAGHLCDIITKVADGAWAIANDAIKHAVCVTGSVVEIVTDLVGKIFDTIFGNCVKLYT